MSTDGNGTETSAAWAELVSLLGSIDETWHAPQKGLDAPSRLEGYRHALHLLSSAIDFYFESDPDRPRLVPLEEPNRKILGDNVDSAYFFTRLSPARRYRIRGRRGNACYLSLTVYGGDDDGSWSDSIPLHLNHRELAFADDGRFEVVLAPEPGPGEHRLDPRATCLITREYFFDHTDERLAGLEIECLDDVPPTAPPTDTELAKRLRDATRFVRDTTQMVPLPAAMLPENGFMDPFPFPPNMRGWGLPDNIYAFGRFELADDEVMEIRAEVTDCAYWGIQTWNFFMQSLDWQHHRVSLNQRQIGLDGPGDARVFLTPGRADRPGWFSTAGHRTGMIFCRWLLSDRMPAKPAVTVRKRAELA